MFFPRNDHVFSTTIPICNYNNKRQFLLVMYVLLHVCTYTLFAASVVEFKVNKNLFLNPIRCRRKQGCQMAYFQTQNTNLGKFWRVLQWKMFVYLWPFGIFYGHLVYFMVIWYRFSHFGML
jgi:hypothetical protein